MNKFGDFENYITNLRKSVLQMEEDTKITIYETISKLNFLNLEIVILYFFVLFAGYILFQYVQFQIQKIDAYSYLFHKKKEGNIHIYNIERCPICLGEFKVPVRASCGHAFCMQCLLSYFQHNKYCWKRLCPLCRDLIYDVYNLQTLHFCKKEKAEIKKMEKQLKDFIKEQNSSISYLSRLEWIRVNKWKSFLGGLSIILFFIALLYWFKIYF